MAELADAQASGACGSNIVWVQVPFPAYKIAQDNVLVLFLYAENLNLSRLHYMARNIEWGAVVQWTTLAKQGAPTEPGGETKEPATLRIRKEILSRSVPGINHLKRRMQGDKGEFEVKYLLPDGIYISIYLMVKKKPTEKGYTKVPLKTCSLIQKMSEEVLSTC